MANYSLIFGICLLINAVVTLRTSERFKAYFSGSSDEPPVEVGSFAPEDVGDAKPGTPKKPRRSDIVPAGRMITITNIRASDVPDMDLRGGDNNVSDAGRKALDDAKEAAGSEVEILFGDEESAPESEETDNESF